MKLFSTSIHRWQPPVIAWRGRVAIAALLVVAPLFVASGLVGSRSLPNWTKRTASLADGQAGRSGSRHRENPDFGSVNQGALDTTLGANQGSDSAGSLARASGATHSKRPNGAGRLDFASSAEADTFLFSALDCLERQVAVAIAQARESVVALEYTAADAPAGTRRIATGVVINQRGELLSVKIDPLVAGDASRGGKNSAPILARDHSGRRLVAHWIAADPETGLTLLRIAARVVRPIRVATDGPKLAGQIFVLGNPFGMGQSVSRGHIAGLDWAMELADRQLGGMIQIQAPLYPGDSGAAVVDVHGELLGLIRSGLAVPSPRSGIRANSSPGTGEGAAPSAGGQAPKGPEANTATAKLDQAERDNDFGFAISARDALWVAEQLHTCGRVDRAYLGVRLEGVPDELATTPSQSSTPVEEVPANASNGVPATAPVSSPPERAESRDRGVLVEVLAGTPAAESGLRTGDRIVSVDGRSIRSAHDLTDRLDRILARTTIRLGVLRGDAHSRERIFLSLRTASRPPRRQVAQLDLTPAQPAPASSATSAPAPALLPPPPTSVPVTATMASGAPAATSTSQGQQGAPAQSAPLLNASPMENAPSRDRTAPQAPALRPDDLRLTLPRAVVERLEQLERRLEKLESPSASGGVKALSVKPDTQIGSVRNP